MMQKRNTWIVTVAAFVLIAGVAVGPALAQAEITVPAARQVVDRYVEALGGEAAIRAHETMVMTGSMEMVGQGMSAEMKIMAMAPNKMKMEITIPGLGNIQSGFDGEVGWSLNPMTGPMVLEGKELTQAMRQADFYSALHGEHLYQSMTNSGQVDFEGKPCWKLDLVTASGDAVTEYFNVETGLIDGMTQTQETQMGEVTVTTVTSDYKEFDGVKAPTRMAATMGPGMEQAFVINSIAFDGVTEADFALPDGIKALVAGENAEVEVMVDEPPALAAPENLKRED